MKRRQLEHPPMEPPARLRRFDPKDWPVEGGDSLDQWRAARSEYVRLYGWFPGDELDELRERRDVVVRYRGDSNEITS